MDYYSLDHSEWNQDFFEFFSIFFFEILFSSEFFIVTQFDVTFFFNSIKDSKIRVYDPLKTEAQQTYSGHGQTVCALAVNKTTQTLVSGSWDKTVKVWRGAWGSLEKKNTKTISQIHQGNFSVYFLFQIMVFKITIFNFI